MILCNINTGIGRFDILELVIIREPANLTNIIQVIDHKLAIFSNKWIWTWLKYLIETFESNHTYFIHLKKCNGMSENNMDLNTADSNNRTYSNKLNSIKTIKQWKSAANYRKKCVYVLRRIIFGKLEIIHPKHFSWIFLFEFSIEILSI